MTGAKNRLPEPLCHENYRPLRKGIYDDTEIVVMVNEAADFAFLDPMPSTDYTKYVPRVEQLGLHSYKSTNKAMLRRLEKVETVLGLAVSMLEVGAGDGSFLALAKERFPSIQYFAVEPDQNTSPARDTLPWLKHFSTLEAAVSAGVRVDLVGLFHVFEHIESPGSFLASVKRLLTPGGVVLIEVPCLLDPLLNLLKSESYEFFYFQRQHPYVYSGPSLRRVLEREGFSVTRMIYFQRYGLENHIQWLSAGRPGGNDELRHLFQDVDGHYRRAFEDSGNTDTVIVETRLAH